MKIVKQHLGYFPMVQLFATVSPITRTVLKVMRFGHALFLFLLLHIYLVIPWTIAQSDIVIWFKVDLTITPEFTWKDRFHGTAQRWWILVEVLSVD